jgi:hypothetical protein
VPGARNGMVSLHYESRSTGAPVLLVMGPGMNAIGWWRTARCSLVVPGQEDVMVPPASGWLLANLIPDTRVLEAARRSSSLSDRRTQRRPRGRGMPHRERRLSERPETPASSRLRSFDRPA